MKKVVILLACVVCSVSALNGQVPMQYRIGEPRSLQSHSRELVQQTRIRGESKSVTSAVVLSLLLPGLGEWYAGNFDTGKYFLIAEGSLWLTYAAFEYRGDWLREDARSFASYNSGAQFSGKSDEFDVDIGNYNSVEDYNQAKLRARQYDKIYDGSAFHWQWNNDANRARFRELRIDSDQMFENAKFVIGAMVINRIVSAFSAGRAAARSGSAEAYRGAWQMGATVLGGVQDAHGIELRVSKEF